MGPDGTWKTFVGRGLGISIAQGGSAKHASLFVFLRYVAATPLEAPDFIACSIVFGKMSIHIL